MSQGIELETSRTDGRTLTNCATLAPIVASRCAFRKLRRNFASFCFVNHLSGGVFNANHNAKPWSSLARKN